MDEANDDGVVAMDGLGVTPPGNVVALTFRRERERPVVSLPVTRPSVLIVEDSAAAAEATGLLLRAAGARVRWADSLASAIRHLRSFAPETVIVDPGLPDGSGFELVSRLNQLGPARPRILVVSGDDTAGSRALQAGADSFMAKPVSAAALLREIVADRAGHPLRLDGAAASAPSLIADLQRARLDVLRAALSGARKKWRTLCSF